LPAFTSMVLRSVPSAIAQGLTSHRLPDEGDVNFGA
jgi:hypothetical protein